MKITAAQIDKLYVFTQQHYVDYFDLQTELVDHLANGIEGQWEFFPKRTFEDALQVEFKKYGVFGFTDLVAKRQQAMGKSYYKLVLKLLKQYITIPKVIQTLFFILLIYMILKYLPFSQYVAYASVFLVLIFLFYKASKSRKEMSKRKTNKQKIWMYEEIIYSCGSSLGLFQFMVQLPMQFFIPSGNRLGVILSNDIGLIVTSIYIVLIGLITYVLAIEIPKKAKKHIAEMHPEYQIV